MVHRRMLMAFLAGTALLTLTAVEAATINYGDFGPVGTGVVFESVTESAVSDPVPLYGPPSAFDTGLDFDPTNFASSAAGGTADITEGQLNFAFDGNVAPPSLTAVQMINVFEAGDFTLAGVGTAVTQAFAGAILRVTVTAIDGVDVAPIPLIPVNASVGFNLLANPGIVQPWSLGLGMNVEAQLTGLGIPFVLGATHVEVVLDNALAAISEPSSVAFIAKKECIIDFDTIVPEPATAILLAVGLCGLATRRRR